MEQRSLLAGDLGALTPTDPPVSNSPVAIVSAAEPSVEFTLELSRPDGSPLTSLAAGEEFVLRVRVQDLRDSPRGVFAAYLDVTWDATKAASTGVVGYGDAYINGRHASIATPGLIDESGAFAHLEEVGGGNLELFSATMKALAPGLLEFQADAADESDTRDVIVYAGDGESSFVPDDATVFAGVSIVVSEASAPVAAESAVPNAYVALPPATVSLPIVESPPLAAVGAPANAEVDAVATDTALTSEVAADGFQSAAVILASEIDPNALLGLLVNSLDAPALAILGNPAAKALVALDQSNAPAHASPQLSIATGANADALALSGESSADDEDLAETTVFDDSSAADGSNQ